MHRGPTPQKKHFSLSGSTRSVSCTYFFTGAHVASISMLGEKTKIRLKAPRYWSRRRLTIATVLPVPDGPRIIPRSGVGGRCSCTLPAVLYCGPGCGTIADERDFIFNSAFKLVVALAMALQHYRQKFRRWLLLEHLFKFVEFC